MKKLKLAIIGLGQRGNGLLNGYLIRQKDIEITHVCDVYADRAEAFAKKIIEEKGDQTKAVTDYQEVLKSDTEAVIVATTWRTHVEIAIAALRAGKITAMEVGGAYSLEECFELVKAYEETKSPFMFLENCCYNRDELLALRLARAGVFGEIVHCSGAYSHDLRYEISHGKELRHYRLHEYLTRDCENYPTHELGPIAKILGINRGNRMVSLVSMSSKASGMERYIEKNAEKLDKDLQGKHFAQGDIVYTLIKCANGETITLKLDTTLPGYYDRELVVKGTDGMYKQNSDTVFIDGVENAEEEIWFPVDSVRKLIGNASRYEHLLPRVWRETTNEEKESGHYGIDGIMLRDFINRAKNGEEMPIDVYDAAAWMAVTALSEKSIRDGSVPMEFPDFTNGAWKDRKAFDCLAEE